MNPEQVCCSDWIRAATLAHMVLCQALPDEILDELVRPAAAQRIRARPAA